ncbi:MAG TPA: hypothetical protein VK469_16070, partial [Candidatus Kapabacteria bacterium]|nr:hypothetical protein [Candidatus Kapabacteria bacterium]
NKELIKKIANAAEFSYSNISNYLNVKIPKRIPLIFYTTHIDFELTNIADYLPPGVVAFAESTSYRVVIQGDASFEELTRVITHELGHIFEYEIMGPSALLNPAPDWVMEGFSDFITRRWDEFSLLVVRDAVLNEQIPQLQKTGELVTEYGNNRTAYDFGHLIYEFIEMKFGNRGVKKFLYTLRKGALFRGQRDVFKVFDYTPKLFNYEFGKYARNRFKAFLTKENPADYSYMIGPDFPFVYSFSHDISPSGELLAVLTVNVKNLKLDLILISLKEGKVIRNITPGFTGKYDYIDLKFNPSDGNSFTWNKNSDHIAFFARREWKNYLVMINILTREIVKKIEIKNIQGPSSPRFHPDGNVIYFTGQEATRSFIYALDLESGNATKLTDGRLFIKGLDISPDGKKIVFSASQKDDLKLFLAPIENPNLAQKLTGGAYDDITPEFSGDSQRIYYSSNELGSYNINALDLGAKTISRYSDVRTGNFFPVEIPGEKNQLVISTFYRNSFSLYKKDIATPIETRAVEFEGIDQFLASIPKEPPVEEVKMVEKGKYKPFKRFYVQSLPPIGVSIGTDGRFFGYSFINISDLMGDHIFSFLLYSYYGYRSYQVTYFNQKGRLNFYGRLFMFKDAYYPYYPYLGRYVTVRSIYGGEAGVFYPFNRSYRLEATTSLYHRDEDYDNIYYGQDLPYGQFFDGMASSVRLSVVGETTLFNYYGPNMGHTFKVSYEKYFKLSSHFMDAYSVEADFRKYLRIGTNTLFAFRLSGFTSGGKNPLLYWTGGDNTFRAAGYRQLVGNHYFLFNAEFRFPIVHLAATPIGLIGPIRGTVFFDMGGIWFQGQDFKMFESGLRLRDGLASYGFGVEFFMFGYPMHFDWVWRTDLSNKRYTGLNFWIGFDF